MTPELTQGSPILSFPGASERRGGTFYKREFFHSFPPALVEVPGVGVAVPVYKYSIASAKGFIPSIENFKWKG